MLCVDSVSLVSAAMAERANKIQNDDVASNFARTFLRSCQDEIPTPIRGKTTGSIPSWLRGCLLRNGPGMLDVGPDRYNHVFDGLAMLQRFAIDDDGITYQTKFLRSEAYVKNTRANRIVVSEFCTAGHTDPCASIFQRMSSFFVPGFSDNALINVMPIGDWYYAMTETPYLHRIDPANLDTLTRFDLRQVVAVNTATAHPLIDPTDGATYNVGSSKGGYAVVKFPPGESSIGRAELVATVPLRRRTHLGYIHSFGLTEHYIIILEQSLTVNVLKLVLAPVRSQTYSQCFEYDPDLLVCFHVVEKETGKQLETKYVTESFFIFHHINAYEKDNHIVVDLCCHKDDSVFPTLSTDVSERPTTPLLATPRRYVLPLQPDNTAKEGGANMVGLPDTTATATSREDGTVYLRHEDLGPQEYPFFCEMPRINDLYVGKSYRYFYIVAEWEGSETALMKVDLEKKARRTYSIQGWTATEPLFVPRLGASSEDDGIVLSVFLNTAEEQMVTLVILDAENFEELAKAEFVTPVVVPSSFHGWFDGIE
ncbi:beta,beta-carotene 15,15'-dioxygenase-like [Ornithodoros turicata]|uniref:beta,beta-carotene 15,15'-dioxygenase-like n=1 Tax=Ornithodoros turicata TaxID=34597 RepID=UPI00313936C3